MAVSRPSKVAAELIEAMGLSGHLVRSIEIRIALNEVVTAKVEVLTDDGAVQALTKAFRERLETDEGHLNWKEPVEGWHVIQPMGGNL